jgi:hypothetical protein
MTTETASLPSVAKPRRAAGIAGQVLGVAGLIVCLVLAALVLLGRGWAVERVDALGTRLDAGLQRGLTTLAAADDRVADASERVGQAGDVAGRIAATNVPAPDAAQALSARLSSISERYLALRAAYADARADLVSAVDSLDAVTRFVPGLSVPQGPVDALSSLDASIRGVDEKLGALLSANGEATPVKDVAQRVADAAPAVQASLDQVSGRLDDAGTRLDETRTDLANALGTITTLITVVTLIALLGLLYGAALHLVLLRSARRSA